MDVFALTMRLKEEGAAQVKAAIDKLERSFDGATGKAKAYDMTIGSLKDTMSGFVSAMALGAVLGKVITETTDAEFAAAQLNAALKSTAGVAGQSAESLNAHAQALSYVSRFDDDAITGAQALLLTFTKIGGDTFPKATEAVLNVAQAMGTDLKSAAIQVGKALNDPILGVSALARSGIQFTDAQKDVIAKLVETNKLAEAQAIILAELNTQFSGSAAAAANTFGGALAQLNNELGNLLTLSNSSSGAATAFVQLITNAVIGLNTALTRLGELLPSADSKLGSLVKTLASFAASNNLLFVLSSLGAATKGAAAATPTSGTKGGGAFTSALEGVFAASEQLKLELPKLAKLKALVLKEVSDIGIPFMGQQALPMMTPTIDFAPVLKVAPEADAATRSTLAQYGADVLLEWGAMIDSLENQMATTLADSIGSAFEAAFATGRISEGFRVLGQSMLSGLGSMLQMFGTKALVASKLMATLLESFKSLNPYVAVGAAIGLIALGGALKGVASAAFGGGGGGSSMAAVSGFSGGGSTGTTRLPGLTFGPTASATAGQLRAMAPVNVTIIGPNDPSAQRQMQELIANAQRRGNV
jgi:ElaB/YqjD/DUF883 family membrane-anchored ribosome-binding protein